MRTVLWFLFRPAAGVFLLQTCTCSGGYWPQWDGNRCFFFGWTVPLRQSFCTLTIATHKDEDIRCGTKSSGNGTMGPNVLGIGERESVIGALRHWFAGLRRGVAFSWLRSLRCSYSFMFRLKFLSKIRMSRIVFFGASWFRSIKRRR